MIRPVFPGLLFLPLLLAACAQSGSTAGPAATYRAEPVAGATLPVAWGETEIIVRAQSGGMEIAGASCEAVSPYYRADLVPPARLLVPDFGPSSPSVLVACSAGDVSGNVRVGPVLSAQRSGGVNVFPAVGLRVGGGSPGVGVGIGVSGGGRGTVTGAETGYPDAIVLMR